MSVARFGHVGGEGAGGDGDAYGVAGVELRGVAHDRRRWRRARRRSPVRARGPGRARRACRGTRRGAPSARVQTRPSGARRRAASTARSRRSAATSIPARSARAGASASRRCSARSTRAQCTVERRGAKPVVEFVAQLGFGRDDERGRDRRRAAAMVGDVVEQRTVAVVADRRHGGRAAGGHGAAQVFVAEGQQLGGVAAAAGEDDHVDVVAFVEVEHGVDERGRRRRTRHQRLAEDHGVAREPVGDDRLDVLAHRGFLPADHADHAGQQRQRPAGTLEHAFGLQPLARLGDDRGDRAFAARLDRLGFEPQARRAGSPTRARR